MAGIAGINNTNKSDVVEKMLKAMSHRGWAWHDVVEGKTTTLGMNGTKIQEQALSDLKQGGLAQDGMGDARFAKAQASSSGFVIKRDPIGIAPLYYGWTEDGDFCFASEVKGLLIVTHDIHELLPGTSFDGNRTDEYFHLSQQPPMEDTPQSIAAELRRRLESSVQKCIGNGNVGSWLSGGIDSSALAAIASRYIDRIKTFSVGLPNAPDLEYARIVARHIQSDHHEVILTPNDFIKVLPDVIYNLESFDALLIRSSILNYLVAREASYLVPSVFSGEGGDELFAGYEYLQNFGPKELASELIDIIGRLHNTALQRVDRSASAHGTVPHVALLDPEVVDYALRIPVEYKRFNGVEKWILRRSVADLLPSQIIDRKKAKFWEGGGIQDLLSQYAEENVSTNDFVTERNLKNGWVLNTKEELLYYRIFNEHFGEIKDLSWMGRTKGAPQI